MIHTDASSPSVVSIVTMLVWRPPLDQLVPAVALGLCFVRVTFLSLAMVFHQQPRPPAPPRTAPDPPAAASSPSPDPDTSGVRDPQLEIRRREAAGDMRSGTSRSPASGGGVWQVRWGRTDRRWLLPLLENKPVQPNYNTGVEVNPAGVSFLCSRYPGPV